ncbi:MAG: hypothetical protein K6T83_10525 [Alicyclobacillus sp.]|nr:hypothetical protein [Alicyclobacillus sp.]
MKRFRMFALGGTVLAFASVGALVANAATNMSKTYSYTSSSNLSHVHVLTKSSQGTTSAELQLSQQVASLERQLQVLQYAVAPTSPQEAADTWAKAIKLRNGALQYAIMIPALQKKLKHIYQENNWITGVSSPWVTNYTIKEISASKDGQRHFEIKYSLTDSTKASYTVTESLAVEKSGDNWFVSSIPKDFLSGHGGLNSAY